MKKLTVTNCTPELSKIIQLASFDHGFSWGIHGKNAQYLDESKYAFYKQSKRIYYNSDPQDDGSEIFLDAQTELNKIIKWFHSPCIKVTLNEGHVAEFVNGKIKVGCQTFEMDIIDKLVAAREEYKKLN